MRSSKDENGNDQGFVQMIAGSFHDLEVAVEALTQRVEALEGKDQTPATGEDTGA